MYNQTLVPSYPPNTDRLPMDKNVVYGSYCSNKVGLICLAGQNKQGNKEQQQRDEEIRWRGSERGRGERGRGERWEAAEKILLSCGTFYVVKSKEQKLAAAKQSRACTGDTLSRGNADGSPDISLVPSDAQDMHKHRHGDSTALWKNVFKKL